MTNAVWIYLFEINKVVKFIEKESRMVVARSWGEEEIKSYYLMGRNQPMGQKGLEDGGVSFLHTK